MRVGAFGWGTHVPRSANPNRESKNRPCIVIGENRGKFTVLFGQSEPQDGKRKQEVDDKSAVGARWGLRNKTYFHQPVELMPDDFVCKGCFATDDSGPGSDHIRDYDLWLALRTLAAPRR